MKNPRQVAGRTEVTHRRPVSFSRSPLPQGSNLQTQADEVQHVLSVRSIVLNHHVQGWAATNYMSPHDWLILTSLDPQHTTTQSSRPQYPWVLGYPCVDSGDLAGICGDDQSRANKKKKTDRQVYKQLIALGSLASFKSKLASLGLTQSRRGSL